MYNSELQKVAGDSFNIKYGEQAQYIEKTNGSLGGQIALIRDTLKLPSAQL